MKSGTFVSQESGKTLVLAHANGPNTTHVLAPNAVVTIDGKASNVASLKAGHEINLTGEPATKIVAVSPGRSLNKPAEVFPMIGTFVSQCCHVAVADVNEPTSSNAVEFVTLAPSATVTINGESAKLTDLKAGDRITFTGKPATKIEATR